MRKIAFILFLVVLFSCQRNNTWECEGDCWNGKGIKTFRDGGIEKGTWKDGELIGQGYQFFGRSSDFAGDYYEGEFDKGYNGYGKYYDASDDFTYVGYWKNVKANGKGKFTCGPESKYPNRYYEGEWKDGKRHGFGIKFWGESGKWTNNIYKGEWKNDEMDGYGRYDWTDGSYYEGEWKNSEQHGKGVYTFSNGEKLESEWTEGYCRELNLMLHGESGASFAALLDEISRPYHNATQNFIDTVTEVFQESIKNDNYEINIPKLKVLRDNAMLKLDSTIYKLEQVPEFDEKIKYKSIYISNIKFESEFLNEFELWFELMQNDNKSEKLEQVNNSIIEKLMTMEKNQKELEKIRSKFERKHIQ